MVSAPGGPIEPPLAIILKSAIITITIIIILKPYKTWRFL